MTQMSEMEMSLKFTDGISIRLNQYANGYKLTEETREKGTKPAIVRVL